MDGRFQPARKGGQSFFDTRRYSATAGQTFKEGAILILAAGKVSEGGADPTAIVGLAMQDAFSGPGNNMGFAPMLKATTGSVDDCMVALANDNTLFMGQFIGAADAIITPTDALIGAGLTYAVRRVAGTGIWYVDSTIVGTAAARVKVLDFDAELKIVFFKFLAANIL